MSKKSRKPVKRKTKILDKSPDTIPDALFVNDTDNEGCFVTVWRMLFGKPKPKEVWKTEREQFIRKEFHFDTCLNTHIYHDVYALHQVSLTTGNERIVEDWRLV